MTNHPIKIEIEEDGPITVSARDDLPTLPLRVVQTQGGYKAIYDAEDRLVCFGGMREDDGPWGRFLTERANQYDAFRTAAEAALKLVSGISLDHGCKDISHCETCDACEFEGVTIQLRSALNTGGSK